MGQVLHGSATTTEAVRRAIQRSQESLRALAKRYGINQKTVAKWRNRNSVADERTGPRDPKSTVLTVEEEAIIVTFRRHTLLPLDDCLYALQAARPYPQPLRQSPKGDILILHKQGTFSLPSVPMMMRHRPAGSLPLRAEVTTSDGYARFDS